MSDSPIQTCISNQYIDTHSLIQLQIPQHLKDKNCSFQWFSNHHGSFFSNYHHDNNIFTRIDLTRISKHNQYQCTPLDYGAIIAGKILSENNGKFQVIKQYRFGPVVAEGEISNLITPNTKRHVKVIVNKNQLIEADIKIVSPSFIIQNDPKITIQIQSQDFKFGLQINKNVRLPSNNSIFKVYDKQQDSLGISMYHQHQDFMERLKNIKIYSHFGFYIKIYFENRLQRDAFLFELIQAFGMKIKQFGKQRNNEFKIVIKQSQIIDKQYDLVQTVKRKQSDKKKDQIDEEIFKLLYQASQKDRLSFDLADAQGLFASSKKLDLSNSRLLRQLKDSDCWSLEKKSQFLGQKNSSSNNQQQSRPNEFSCFNERKPLQTHTAQMPPRKFEQPSIRKNVSTTTFTKQDNENYLRTTISKLNSQIQNLMKQNKKLSQQNKKLRDQNMRLRFKDIKNTSIRINHEKIGNSRIKQSIFGSNEKSISISISPNSKRKQNSQHAPDIFKNLKANAHRLDNQQTKNQTKSYARLVKPSQLSQVIFTPNSQACTQWGGPLNFQHVSQNAMKDFIKQQHPQVQRKEKSPLEKILKPRSKQFKDYRSSFDVMTNPKRFIKQSQIQKNSNFEMNHHAPPETPGFSQVIHPHPIKIKNFGTNSTLYAVNSTYRR